MAFVDDKTSDDLEMDTHLYDLRSMDDPLVRRLVEAADKDIEVQMSKGDE